MLYFVLYSLPLCPTFAPSGQPNSNPLNLKTICLNKCFDSHCERKNSSHWCDGIVSCYWCRNDKNGRKLEKPYCASSERCFRGIESATYERKSTFLTDLSFIQCFISLTYYVFTIGSCINLKLQTLTKFSDALIGIFSLLCHITCQGLNSCPFWIAEAYRKVESLVDTFLEIVLKIHKTLYVPYRKYSVK